MQWYFDASILWINFFLCRIADKLSVTHYSFQIFQGKEKIGFFMKWVSERRARYNSYALTYWVRFYYSMESWKHLPSNSLRPLPWPLVVGSLRLTRCHKSYHQTAHQRHDNAPPVNPPRERICAMHLWRTKRTDWLILDSYNPFVRLICSLLHGRPFGDFMVFSSSIASILRCFACRSVCREKKN